MGKETGENQKKNLFFRLKNKFVKNYKQIGLVVAAFLSMILISSFYVSSIIRRQMNTISDEIMNTVQANVQANLTEAELVFSFLSGHVQDMLIESGNEDLNDRIFDYFSSVDAEYSGEDSPLPDYMSLYGYIRGTFIEVAEWVPPDDYDATTRPWYIGAKDIDSIFFTEPYVDADTGNICVSFSLAVTEASGEFTGVVAIDIALTRITDYLKNQKIAGNGYGVLLDDKLAFFQHPDESFIGRSMTEIGGGYRIAAAILSKNTENLTVSAVFRDENGVSSLGFFKQVSNISGWYIGVITPRSSYYQQAYIMVAVLAVVGFALMTALSALIIRTNNAKEAAHEESVRKSKFLAKMSHEMRTPMNAIIGMTNLGLGADTEERKDYCLGRIGQASSHLLGVINDVLDMSKIEAGKLTISESGFSLNSLLEQVTTVVGYKIEEKNQEFSVDIAADAPKAIVSDRQRLAQVITNLLSNANKFTPEKGTISLKVYRAEGDGGQPLLAFEVKDSGIGISKENQTKLFKAFAQADNSISRRFGGTGLGLAISKKIVEALGGDIWLVSEEGKGSLFGFKIPAKECVVEGKIAESTKEENTTAGCLKDKRILIAEDVDINREIVGALLEETCAEIDFAEDGSVALEKYFSSPEKYDIILMDIQMPNVDGLTATERIRAGGGRGAEIPIIAMTANAFKEDVGACIAAGMNDHIGKPIDFEDMLSKICKHL